MLPNITHRTWSLATGKEGSTSLLVKTSFWEVVDVSKPSFIIIPGI